MAAADGQFICPVCWHSFAAKEIDADWSTCPDCYSEAVEVDVLPFDKFVESKSIDEMLESMRAWKAAKNLREEFRRKVLQRIREVLKYKRSSTN